MCASPFSSLARIPPNLDRAALLTKEHGGGAAAEQAGRYLKQILSDLRSPTTSSSFLPSFSFAPSAEQSEGSSQPEEDAGGPPPSGDSSSSPTRSTGTPPISPQRLIAPLDQQQQQQAPKWRRINHHVLVLQVFMAQVRPDHLSLPPSRGLRGLLSRRPLRHRTSFHCAYFLIS